MGISLAALLLSLTGAIDVSVDWAAFKAGADSSRVEFFYGLRGDQLLYTVTDSGMVASFSVSMEMTGISNQFHESGTIRKRARVKDYKEVVQAQRSFVDAFSVTAPPGRYRYRISVAETTESGATGGTAEDSLELVGFDKGLSLSSLQTGTQAVADTTTGALSVIPTPSHRFPAEGLEVIYVYYEGYNLAPDSGSYEVRAQVLRRRAERTDTMIQVQPVVRRKHGSMAAYAFGVNVKSLPQGSYVLAVELTDQTTKQSVSRERAFSVGEAEEAAPVAVKLEGLGPVEQTYVDSIQYLATPTEQRYYKKLSDAGKQEFLVKFWKTHNLSEFARRMEVAGEKYGMPKIAGVKTDRGRVYVKYGEPDAVEQKVIESETRPREYWHYYSTGYVFIFIDIRGDANYRLAWTNAKGEPPTGFELYLTPDEEEEFNTNNNRGQDQQ
jgi:GWxTD domain-containing protein